MDTKREIASRIRGARLDRGLTQAEVARALGLHRPAISEIEAGRRSVSGEEVVELARVLAVPVSGLLGSEGQVDEVEPSTDAEVSGTVLEMARTIVEGFDPERVILFGSHAQGTAGPDSDVDLLVVMEPIGSRRQTGARIGAALHGFPLPKDIVVTTPRAFEERRDLPGTIERWATREGKVLFDRG